MTCPHVPYESSESRGSVTPRRSDIAWDINVTVTLYFLLLLPLKLSLLLLTLSATLNLFAYPSFLLLAHTSLENWG